MRKMILALSAATLTVPAVTAAPAFAHPARSYQSQQHYAGTSCRKSSGTTGLVVGGAAGALAGRAIDKNGSRTTGTVLGAAVGALLGRHVQRNVISSRRC